MDKRTPEAFIANLRHRRVRIIFYIIFIIVSSALAIIWGYFAVRLGTMLVIHPETKDIETETTMLTFFGPLTAVGAACCFTLCLTQCILLGSAIATLIAELATYTKDQLLVEMWDRIKEIQSKIDKQTG
jgi:glucan phosphoethanolaminetransferase (alkaline phosphatase superfamily)